MLAQILTPSASDRLGRIRLVNEGRATSVENRLIMLAQTGQIREKVDEERLKELLGWERSGRKEEKIVVRRRGGARWDEESEGEERRGGGGGGGRREEEEEEEEDESD